MFKSFLTAATLAAIGIGYASSASAVSLTYLGASSGSDRKTVNIVESSVTGGVTGTVGAWGFNMDDDGDAVTDFVAWCLDITNTLKSPWTYVETNDPWSFTSGAVPIDAVQTLFDAVFASVDVTDGVEAAAFQVALWETIYDADTSLTNDTAGADFRVWANGSTVSNAVTAKAVDYLALASAYEGGNRYRLSFFEAIEVDGRRSQSLVSVSEVPLPATALLLLGGLSGLAAVRRKRA